MADTPDSASADVTTGEAHGADTAEDLARVERAHRLMAGRHPHLGSVVEWQERGCSLGKYAQGGRMVWEAKPPPGTPHFEGTLSKSPTFGRHGRTEAAAYEIAESWLERCAAAHSF